MRSIHLSQVFVDSNLMLLAYDLFHKSIISDLTDYSYEMSRSQHKPATVVQECTYIKEFIEYLLNADLVINEVDDNVLESFRNEQLKKVLNSRSHRGHESAAKTTVNGKLSRVYHWLYWLQDVERISSGRIGPKGHVRSDFTISGKRSHTGQVFSVWDSSIKIICPIAYVVPNRKSKHRAQKDIPSECTVDDLHEKFFECSENLFIAHRNSLFIDIASTVGLRRGSICSLLTTQFEADDIDKASDKFWVLPSNQKYSYVNSFGFPLYLAREIQRYIETTRADLIRDKNVSLEIHQNRLFISAKDGAPLRERSMTAIVSTAMRELGFKKGTAIHSFRFKALRHAKIQELLRRKEMGLATDSRTLDSAIALEFGHSNVTSQLAYAASDQTISPKTEHDKAVEDNARLRQENRKLSDELKSMKKIIKK